MGRRESHIIGDGPVAELAHALRELRSRACLTYRDMCAITHYSRAALNNAATGKRCPTWEVVYAFVTSCGGEVDDRWHSLWEAAALASSARHPGNPNHGKEVETTDNPGKPSARPTVRKPNPWQDTPAEFVYELRLLRKLAGSPNGVKIGQVWSERTSTKPRSYERKVLPKSTLNDALNPNRHTLPKLDVVQMIVNSSCADVEEWTEAWQRIAAIQFEARHPPPGTTITPGDPPA